MEQTGRVSVRDDRQAEIGIILALDMSTDKVDFRGAIAICPPAPKTLALVCLKVWIAARCAPLADQVKHIA